MKQIPVVSCLPFGPIPSRFNYELIIRLTRNFIEGGLDLMWVVVEYLLQLV